MTCITSESKGSKQQQRHERCRVILNQSKSLARSWMYANFDQEVGKSRRRILDLQLKNPAPLPYLDFWVTSQRGRITRAAGQRSKIKNP